ncbi:MAG: ABC transporter permease [Clostridia bacterium]|nr:ABC transporter permease [Clostridia bacterium]
MEKKFDVNVNPRKRPFSMQLDLSKFEPASDAEKAQQDRMKPSTTFFKDGIKRLSSNVIAMICFAVIVVIALMAIIIPEVWPYHYEEQLGLGDKWGSVDATYKNLKPFQYGQTELDKIAAGEEVFPHVFGTDSLGRDYFARVIFGARVSLAIGLFASLIVLVIGMIYGSISGYAGGKVDLVMMRIVDIIYSLPDMLMIILLATVLNASGLKDAIMGTVLADIGINMLSIFIVFGLLYWVGMARLIRGQVLSIKQQEYVLAAQSVGASTGRIIKKHLLPNCMSVIIISTALQIPSAIFTESFLSFLGLGVEAPMPSLGSLASEALGGINSFAYLLWFPALTIFLIVLSFNLFGNGLRDAFDPKLRN